MNAIDLMQDCFVRVSDTLPHLLDGLSGDDLLWRPGPKANPMAWLVWHISRCEDSELDALTDIPQAWGQGWQQKFALPYPPEDGGYGQTNEQVAAFNVSDPDLLLGYFYAASARAAKVLEQERAKDLDRIVDTNWNPPVKAGTRLVSVAKDSTQHLGARGYVRGLVETR